jgi:hypothetical protein
MDTFCLYVHFGTLALWYFATLALSCQAKRLRRSGTLALWHFGTLALRHFVTQAKITATG